MQTRASSGRKDGAWSKIMLVQGRIRAPLRGALGRNLLSLIPTSHRPARSEERNGRRLRGEVVDQNNCLRAFRILSRRAHHHSAFVKHFPIICFSQPMSPSLTIRTNKDYLQAIIGDIPSGSTIGRKHDKQQDKQKRQRQRRP